MMRTPIRCLVVEDNPNLREDLVFFLGSMGFYAAGAPDGATMDHALADSSWDIIVLDLTLPDEDGLVIARRLSAHTNLGLVILTARDCLEDRLAGWESGAHVYLVKPVPLEEIAAVAGAVYRKLHPEPKADDHPWRFYPDRRELIAPNGAVIALTHRERLLIQAFCETPQRCLKRDLTLSQDEGGALDTLIHRLRRKLKQHGDPIRTVYGEGFVFDGELQRLSSQL
jgi:DNA-binding response OmpR family regulator